MSANIRNGSLSASADNFANDWLLRIESQRIIAHFFLFSFLLHESVWCQRQTEVLDAAQRAGWDILLGVSCRSKGIKTGWWPHRRHAYSPDFQP